MSVLHWLFAGGSFVINRATTAVATLAILSTVSITEITPLVARRLMEVQHVTASLDTLEISVSLVVEFVI